MLRIHSYLIRAQLNSGVRRQHTSSDGPCEERGMAKLVFGMNQSLDGYVDHMAFAPSSTLFRHFIEEAQGQAGSVYGRRMFEIFS